LLLNYRSFKAVIGCPPDSSSSGTVHQHTQRATPHSAQNWLRASCPDFITKDQWPPNSLNINPMDGVQCWRFTATWNKAEDKRRTQGSAPGYLGQPATGTDRQGCKRFLK